MYSKLKIKICGMTDIDNLCKILFLAPDYLGFIFFPTSPRYVVGKLDPDQLSIIPPRVKRVGVFVGLRIGPGYILKAPILEGKSMCP